MATRGVCVVPNAIVRDGIVPLNERVVLITLASHAGSEKVCRVLRSTLVRETGLGRTTITRALRWLSEAGYVSIKHNRNGQALVSSTYRLNLEVYQDVTVDEDLPEEPESKDATGPTPGPETAHPRPTQDPPRTTDGPPRAATGPVIEKNLYKRTSEKTPSSPPTSGDARSSPSVPATVADDPFEIWWQAYPKKDRKVVTRAAYEAAVRQGVTEEVLLAGARGYARVVKREERAFDKIQAPSEWLRLERWTDEYTITTDNGKWWPGD